ncbi:MAG: hypothetical protein AABX11_02500 [Nanoarchaeota archaeon]
MTDRTGLYIMVAITALISMSNDTSLDKANERLELMQKEIRGLREAISVPVEQPKSPVYYLKEEVVGTKTNRFFEVNGLKAYMVIDGKPVENYTR